MLLKSLQVRKEMGLHILELYKFSRSYFVPSITPSLLRQSKTLIIRETVAGVSIRRGEQTGGRVGGDEAHRETQDIKP